MLMLIEEYGVVDRTGSKIYCAIWVLLGFFIMGAAQSLRQPEVGIVLSFNFLLGWAYWNLANRLYLLQGNQILV